MNYTEYPNPIEAKLVSEFESIRVGVARLLEMERARRGLSKQDFAEMTTTPRTSLTRMLSGDHVTLESYFLVVEKLGIPFRISVSFPPQNVGGRSANFVGAEGEIERQVAKLAMDFVSQLENLNGRCRICRNRFNPKKIVI